MDLLNQLRHSLEEIETKLNISFKDKDLLMMALIHRSFANEYIKDFTMYNERLEFLGDSVLGLIISDDLYRRFPDHPEGELSPMRSRVVDASSCADFVDHLGIGEYLLLGKGQKIAIERGRTSIMADLFEALLGALYLDQGFEAARTFFFAHFSEKYDAMLDEPDRNYKALLQHHIQKNAQQTPTYDILSEEGPDHAKRFVVAVKVGEKVLAEGEGASKKSAQQTAAKAACEQLGLI